MVWSKSIQLSVAVYTLTRSFPAEERFGLSSQIRRSAVSVASNIAEGAGRGSTREFVRFLRIARGSLVELETQLEIARRCGMIGSYDSAEELATAVGQMLSALLRSLSRKNRHF